MANQVACIEFPGKSFFRTNGQEAHLFGLEPNYGCCTANLSQGWPKLALYALQRTERGVLCAHLLPASISTEIDGKHVSVQVSGDYPFRMHADITIEAPEAVTFELSIRIPAWAKDVRLDGRRAVRRGDRLILCRRWQGRQTLRLTMQAQAHMTMRPLDLRTVEYGPLVFSLPIQTEYRMKEFTRNGVERKFPYCDYELIPHSAWNYGFADKALTVKEQPVDAVPFSSAHPPLVIEAALAPVKWDWADGYDTVPAAAPAERTACGPAQTMKLIPYGCAKLRMTEMPLLPRH